ncbi:integrase [Bradyrhizobium sp. S3.14.4]
MKRSHGDGGVDQRGENTYRLRYRVGGKRHTKTFHGTLTEARKELRALVRSGDVGEHVDPSKLTVGRWIDQWIEAGAPGRKRKKVSQRTLERYEELLRVHVKPKLGERPLQKLAATEIDALYGELEAKIAPMTAHHVHVTFNSCLSTAERKGLLRANPMRRVDQIPSPGESDHGVALDETELAKLVAGFRPSPLFPIVALTAAIGARRNEVLALRWSDLTNKALRIERALDFTKAGVVGVKVPKTARGLRTVALDDATVAMLLRERERHQRILAGVPDGVEVDLSLVRLPADGLMFPNIPGTGEDFSFTTPRNPRNFSKEFARRAKLLGFPVRYHDLRGTHATLLLDRGVPVHTVAERIGDDPAVLLRNYAKRTRGQTVDSSVSAVISSLAASFLGT